MNSNFDRINEIIKQCIAEKSVQPLKDSDYVERHQYRYKRAIQFFIDSNIKSIDFRLNNEISNIGKEEYQNAMKWIDMKNSSGTAIEIESRLIKTSKLLSDLGINERGKRHLRILETDLTENELLNLAVKIYALSAVSSKPLPLLMEKHTNEAIKTAFFTNLELIGVSSANNSDRKHLYEIRALVKTLIDLTRERNEKMKALYAEIDTDDFKTLDNNVAIIVKNYYFYL